MDRRGKTITGLVNFPVDDEDYEHTGEGGMFVRLVIEPTEAWMDWIRCCGGEIQFARDEAMVGDDHESETKAHFPDLEDGPDERSKEKWGDMARYMSTQYCSVIYLGSTGWSGFHKATEEYWTCQYEDLTEEGKLLYDTLKKLHEGNAQLLLQTWLDT